MQLHKSGTRWRIAASVSIVGTLLASSACSATPSSSAPAALSSTSASTAAPSSDSSSAKPAKSGTPAAVSIADLKDRTSREVALKEWSAAATAMGYKVTPMQPEAMPPKPELATIPKPPVPPTAKDDAAAFATIDVYLQAYSYYIASADREPMQYMEVTECESCDSVSAPIERFSVFRGFSTRPDIRATNYRIHERRNEGLLVQADLAFTQFTTYLPELSTRVTTPDLSGKWLFELHKFDDTDGWYIGQISRLS